MKRSAISRTALWAIIAVVIVVVIVGGVAAYYVTRPPPTLAPTPTPTPTPTRAIVGQVTIGMELSLTGSLGPIGEEVLWGAQLAAAQINSQGGIYMANGPNGPGNYTINLVWQDDQSNPADGPTVTSTLITSDHAAILITTPASVVAVADIPVIQQYVEPTIAVCASPLVTRTQNLTSFDPAKYMIFHYQPTAFTQGEWQAEFLYYVVKPAVSPNAPLRVDIVTQNTELGIDTWKGINYTIYHNGWQNQIQVVDVITYPFGNTQFQSILTKVASDNVQAVAGAMWPTERAAMMQQAASMPALKGVVFVADAINDDPGYYGIGKPATGTFTDTPYPAYALTSNSTINAKWLTFRSEYKAYTGSTAGTLGATGYDSVWIAAYALKDAGSTNNMAIIHALETMPPPPQLQLLIKPTSRLFNSYHEAAFQPLIIEAFYNSTSNSVYTQVVWPSQYATTSPQFGTFP
jgi:ABC-type branched-subunit amino acid transport system substrate-binding protein